MPGAVGRGRRDEAADDLMRRRDRPGPRGRARRPLRPAPGAAPRRGGRRSRGRWCSRPPTRREAARALDRTAALGRRLGRSGRPARPRARRVARLLAAPRPRGDFARPFARAPSIGPSVTRADAPQGARAGPQTCASGGNRNRTPCRVQRRGTAMAVVTIRQLLDSGVHFGHQTRRWNPKVKRFILTERSGIHIIDLQQSLAYIDKTYDFVKETVAHGGTVLFVGTKKQAQEAIAEQATRVGQPYVNQRWLGGLLTNFQTVAQAPRPHEGARPRRLRRHDEGLHEEGAADPAARARQAPEDARRHPQPLQDPVARSGSIDSKREHLAVDEAKKLGIPVIGILDTNADPDELAVPDPGQRRRDPLRRAAHPHHRRRRGRGPHPASPGLQPGRGRAAGRVGARAPAGEREPGGRGPAGRAGRRPRRERASAPMRPQDRVERSSRTAAEAADADAGPTAQADAVAEVAEAPRAGRGERRGRPGGRRPHGRGRRRARPRARAADRGGRRGRGAREVEARAAPPREGHRPGRDRGPRALRLIRIHRPRPSVQRDPLAAGRPAGRSPRPEGRRHRRPISTERSQPWPHSASLT